MATITSVLALAGRQREPLVSIEATRRVVWLEGECDIATLPVLAETLARMISADDADLVVDLQGVTFIGAATVSALVRTRNTLRRQSRDLTLRSPSPSTSRVLALCGLTALVEPWVPRRMR